MRKGKRIRKTVFPFSHKNSQKAINMVYCGLHAFDGLPRLRLVLRSVSGGEGSSNFRFKIQKAINMVYCELHAFDGLPCQRLVLRSVSGGEGSSNFPFKIQKAINMVYCFLNNI